MDAFAFDTSAFAEELSAAFDNLVVGSSLLLENESVRVWEIVLRPGQRLPFHRHRTSYLYRAHRAGRVQVRFPDGTGAVYDEVAGAVSFHAIGPDDVVVHDLENVGETVLEYTTVELLGH